MSLLSLIAKLGVDINPFKRGLDAAKGHARKWGGEVTGGLKNQFAGILGTAAIIGLGRHTMAFADQIAVASKRLSVGAETLQEWNYAAAQTGAQAEDVTRFFEALNRAREASFRGEQKMIDNFQRLGLTLKDLRNMRTEEIGKHIANAVQKGDVQKLSAALQGVGSESATKLVAAFRSGLDIFAADVRQMGMLIDEDLVAKLDVLEDKQTQVMRTLMGPMATFLGWIATGVEKLETMFQLLGAFSAQKFSWTDFLSPSEGGGIGKKWQDFLESDEAKKIINRGAAPQASAGAGTGGGTVVENAKEKLQLDEKIKNLQRQIMSDEQKRVELQKDLAAAQKAYAAAAAGSLESKQAELAIAESISALEKLRAKPAKLGLLPADSLRQVGGFLGNQAKADPVLDLARQSLKVQQDIAKNTDPTLHPKIYI